VYLALAALVGHIAAASQELIPPQPSAHYPYDHEDLLFTFRRIREHVAAVCDSIQETFATYRLAYNTTLNRYQVDLPSFWQGQVLGLTVSERPGKRVPLADVKNLKILVERDQRVVGDQAKRAVGAHRLPRGDKGIPPAVNDRLGEIAPPRPDAVDLYWIDPASPDLQDGTGPFLVYTSADSDKYELTLYVSYPPKTEK
jgi:hypothetical protein